MTFHSHDFKSNKNSIYVQRKYTRLYTKTVQPVSVHKDDNMNYVQMWFIDERQGLFTDLVKYYLFNNLYFEYRNNFF